MPTQCKPLPQMEGQRLDLLLNTPQCTVTGSVSKTPARVAVFETRAVIFLACTCEKEDMIRPSTADLSDCGRGVLVWKRGANPFVQSPHEICISDRPNCLPKAMTNPVLHHTLESSELVQVVGALRVSSHVRKLGFLLVGATMHQEPMPSADCQGNTHGGGTGTSPSGSGWPVVSGRRWAGPVSAQLRCPPPPSRTLAVQRGFVLAHASSTWGSPAPRFLRLRRPLSTPLGVVRTVSQGRGAFGRVEWGSNR